MKEFTYVIADKLGIHARPAGMLAKEAKKYESEIRIKKEEKEVQATQLIMLMSLGVKCGDEVTISIDGVDEDVAYVAMLAFMENNL